MPIYISLIKVMQMYWIILLFCNTQVGLVVIILSHLFHLCNTLWTYWQYNIQPNSHPSLGLATKARACKSARQEGSSGVTFHVPGSVGECERMNTHIPKRASKFSKNDCKGQNPLDLLISLKNSWNVNV